MGTVEIQAGTVGEGREGEPRWETTLLLCELEMFFFPFPVTSGAAEQHSTVGLRRVRRHSPSHRANPSMAMGVMVIAVGL